MLSVAEFNQVLLAFVDHLVSLGTARAQTSATDVARKLTDAQPLAALTFVRESFAPFHERIMHKDPALLSDPAVLAAISRIAPFPVKPLLDSLPEESRASLLERFSSVWLASQVVTRLS